MKIALVTTNLRGGGAERVFIRLASMLGGRGHEVHIVLLEYLVDHSIDDGLSLHALTQFGRACRKGFIGKHIAAWRLRSLVAKLSATRPFDLVISTLPFADEVARIARLPRLWHRIANTLSAEVARLHGDRRSRRLARYRRLYRDARLIAVSDGVADDLRREMGLTNATIRRIYNPYDFDAIRRLAAEPAPQRPDGRYVIHVGRFAAQKRHDLLFDAWRRLDVPERLVLLTPPHEGLDRLIAEHGLSDRVLVAGFQANPYPWMRGARLLVLCSDHEGMPNVLVEALACGAPVVSTDCPSGPREILGSDSRWLVPCRDPARLAAAIRDALQSESMASVDLSRFDAPCVLGEIEALAAIP